MGIQQKRKSTFFTAFEHRKKEAFDIAVVFEWLCHLKAQYPVQSRNICSGKQILLFVHRSVSNGMTVLFALLALMSYK